MWLTFNARFRKSFYNAAETAQPFFNSVNLAMQALPVVWTHRRRIKTKEKAKVVAAA